MYSYIRIKSQIYDFYLTIGIMKIGRKFPLFMKKRLDTFVSNLCIQYGGAEGI